MREDCWAVRCQYNTIKDGRQRNSEVPLRQRTTGERMKERNRSISTHSPLVYLLPCLHMPYNNCYIDTAQPRNHRPPVPTSDVPLLSLNGVPSSHSLDIRSGRKSHRRSSREVSVGNPRHSRSRVSSILALTFLRLSFVTFFLLASIRKGVRPAVIST